MKYFGKSLFLWTVQDEIRKAMSSKKAPVELWNALIRTHHVTSRKKVSKLKKEAKEEASYVLIRSGGSPGLMYVEGDEQGVKEWVDAVHVCLQTLSITLAVFLTATTRVCATKTTTSSASQLH